MPWEPEEPEEPEEKPVREEAFRREEWDWLPLSPLSLSGSSSSPHLLSAPVSAAAPGADTEVVPFPSGVSRGLAYATGHRDLYKVVSMAQKKIDKQAYWRSASHGHVGSSFPTEPQVPRG